MRTFLAVVLILISCAFALAESAIFDYDDFGPQVLAYEIIGYQWYQWNSFGDSDPDKTDHIKVVVFWDESIEKIKKQFPVSPQKTADYRYITYKTAVKYLNAAINEFPDAGNLIDTRNTLLKRKMK